MSAAGDPGGPRGGGGGGDRGADADADALARLGRELAPLDVDTTTAEQMARRARESVGKPPPRRRWIVPGLAAAAALAYGAWLLLKTLELLG